jgi:hypothetical protein
MKLQRIGYFRELCHGDLDGPSLRDSVQQQANYDVKSVANYLRTAPVLYAHFGLVQDILNPSHSYIGSANIRTDGVWIWPEDLAYYMEHYNIALPLDFLEHVKLRRYQSPTNHELNLVELEF